MTELSKDVTALERDEARQIVRDIYWMARRYADGRSSYAPSMFNDAIDKAFIGGWLDHKLDEPAKARDGMFSPEWVSLEGRLAALQSQCDRYRVALEAIAAKIESQDMQAEEYATTSFECAYDECIQIADTALSDNTTSEGGL